MQDVNFVMFSDDIYWCNLTIEHFDVYLIITVMALIK
jgi:hypothetical protein